MNYENIRLNKGMYKSEKGFSQALETLDPSKSYIGTELAGLDAYERQLKRFGIKVSGANSDVIAKFFQTSDSATLFPEYVSRAVAQGMRDVNIIDEIVASKTNINSLDYRSITPRQISVDSEFDGTKIVLNSNLTHIKKRGRLLVTSYEAIKFQRIDVFTVALKQIGAYITKTMLKDAVEILLVDCEPVSKTNILEYSHMLDLWGKFDGFEMNTLLASPEIAVGLLAIKEFQSIDYSYGNTLISPMGAKLFKSKAVPKGMMIALDRRFALEMVEAGGVSVEYDKLIDTQFERAAITSIFGFNKIFPDAVKILKVV